jgi:hypothetical protein
MAAIRGYTFSSFDETEPSLGVDMTLFYCREMKMEGKQFVGSLARPN